MINVFLTTRDNARFLWKRVPSEHKKGDPEVAAAWAIGSRMWQGDYAAAYEAMKSTQWKPATAPVVAWLEGRFLIYLSVYLVRVFPSTNFGTCVKSLLRYHQQSLGSVLRSFCC